MRMKEAVGLTVVVLLGLGTAWSEEKAGKKEKAGLEWTSDLAAARTKAAKEGKDLFLDFTGSDWCSWCKKLKAEVFDQEAFAAEAAKQFVFVELDFPRTKPQPEETKTRNQKLAREFGIRGFPTVVLTDAKGRAYARTGYKRGGAEAYLKHLAELRAVKTARDEKLAQAAKADGVEKARCLDAALAPLIKRQVFVGYDDCVNAIIAADAENKLGLKAKYFTLRTWKELRDGDNDFAGCAAKLDAFIKKYAPKGEAAQELLFLKSFCVYRTGDKKGALTLLKKAAAVAPATARAQMINRMIKNLEPQKAGEKTGGPKAPVTKSTKKK